MSVTMNTGAIKKYFPATQTEFESSKGSAKAASYEPSVSVSAKLHYETPYYQIPVYPTNTTAAIGKANYTAFMFAANEVVNAIASKTGADENIVGRALQYGITVPLGLFQGIVQHETGHGYRYWEQGVPVEYEFGVTNGRTCPQSDKELPLEARILMNGGGFEGNHALTNYIADQTMLYGGDARNSFLYFANKLNQTYYIAVGPYARGEHKDNNDVYNYVENMTELGGGDPGFTRDDIRFGAYWNLADPTTLLTLYNSLRYVATGEKRYDIPDFLPRTGFLLTPLGPEYYFSTPFRYNKTLFDPYFRMAVNSDGNSYGGGVHMKNINLDKRISMDADVDVWVQDKELGGMFKDVVYFPINNGMELGIGGSAKSRGYVPGQPLDAYYGFVVDTKIEDVRFSARE